MKPVTGAEMLLEAHRLITNDRNNSYGHPLDDYSRTVDIFRAITGVELTAEQGLLFMVAVKLSRLGHNLNLETLHQDSLVDAAGYLGCLAMIDTERHRRSV